MKKCKYELTRLFHSIKATKSCRDLHGSMFILRASFKHSQKYIGLLRVCMKMYYTVGKIIIIMSTKFISVSEYCFKVLK